MLRNSLLQLVQERRGPATVEKAPVSRARRPALRRRRRTTRDAVRAAPSCAGHRPAARRSTTSARTPPTSPRRARTRDAYVAAARGARRGRPHPARHGRGERSSSARSARTCPGDGHKIALEHAREICQAAAKAGTTVTLDMEDHTTTDRHARRPARAAPGLPDGRRGAPGLPAPHRGRLPRPRRTRAAGCACARAPTRSRSRWPSRIGAEVDKSYVRCLKVLMAGEGYPMVASHDPRLVEIAGALAAPPPAARPTASSTRCSTASAPTSRSGSPTAATRCASTSPTATSGTATSCAGWPRSPPTSCSSCAALATKG